MADGSSVGSQPHATRHTISLAMLPRPGQAGEADASQSRRCPCSSKLSHKIARPSLCFNRQRKKETSQWDNCYFIAELSKWDGLTWKGSKRHNTIGPGTQSHTSTWLIL